MAINGIETVLYGVEDVATSTRYFEDFGLPLFEKSDTHAHFQLDEGSNVILRAVSDSAIPRSRIVVTGVHEPAGGVDAEASLESLVRSLGTDREVRRDTDGTAHCLDDDGLAIALRVFCKTPVVSAPDPCNSPGN